MARPTSIRSTLLIAATSVAVAGAGCAAQPDPAVSDPTAPASAPASWQPILPSWPSASIAPEAGVDHACVLSEAQAEAILGRDVATPEVAEGAYDNVACQMPALPPNTDFPIDISIEMSPPVFNAARRVTTGFETAAGQPQLGDVRELPTDRAAYFYRAPEPGPGFGSLHFALGDRVVALHWRAREDETDDDLAATAMALIEAISANWLAGQH